MVGAAPVVARRGSLGPRVCWWNVVGMRGELEYERTALTTSSALTRWPWPSRELNPRVLLESAAAVAACLEKALHFVRTGRMLVVSGLRRRPWSSGRLTDGGRMWRRGLSR